jgi:chorismate dehydratase
VTTERGVRPWAALDRLKIGCVQYLNSRPLIHAYDRPIVLAHPSELADELAAGHLDAALVPMFEVLRNPVYTLVDDVAIASSGPVFSVYLAYRRPLREIRTVALDPASRTSVHLLQVLLAEYYQLRPDCRRPEEFTAQTDAELLIGNQAIEARLAGRPAQELLDLGEEWKCRTGLPFVFAAWALRPGLERTPEIGDAFRALKAYGLSRLGEVVAEDQIATPEFRRTYLNTHIRFDLGNEEKEGIARYRELLEKYGFIGGDGQKLRFV